MSWVLLLLWDITAPIVSVVQMNPLSKSTMLIRAWLVSTRISCRPFNPLVLRANGPPGQVPGFTPWINSQQSSIGQPAVMWRISPVLQMIYDGLYCFHHWTMNQHWHNNFRDAQKQLKIQILSQSWRWQNPRQWDYYALEWSDLIVFGMRMNGHPSVDYDLSWYQRFTEGDWG
jgi:hypothetical protein